MDTQHIEKSILSDPLLHRLSTLAKKFRIPIFLVGGYIRDRLLGMDRNDYDFTLPREGTHFIPDIEEALQIHFFRVGKEDRNTLTYRWMDKDRSIDLTPFQGQTIEEDLHRRDFTINAIAYSLKDGTFHWVKRAFEDIEEKIIRMVSNLSIDQDPLRMLRAIRYLCTLKGFSLDDKLKEEIYVKKELLCLVPGERIKMELDRIFLSSYPAYGMNTLYELGLLLTLFPELKGLKHLGHGQYHHLNALSHTLLMIEKISWAIEWLNQHQPSLIFSNDDWLTLFYSALFHDLGKQETYSKDEKGEIHFYFHESSSSQLAEKIMERLHFSTTMKKRISHIIQNHMRILNLNRETKDHALKRLVNQIGDDVPLLILHTLADKEASRGILSIQIDEVIETHCIKLLQFFKEKTIVNPPVLVTGYDVMALGYSSGPKIGEILKFIREKQIEGEIKTREDALQILRERFGDGK
ncbi:MAG: CCA tRNA nucleotidyltransferase [Thermodesulfobacteriota bacterium]